MPHQAVLHLVTFCGVTRYTFDLTLCDDIFEVLLKHTIIKLPGHKVIPSPHDLDGRVYCKSHNSFDHSTRSCNAFRLVIQSANDKGQLRFAYLCKDDQLTMMKIYCQISNHKLIHAKLKI
jgi:hypothetical protein